MPLTVYIKTDKVTYSTPEPLVRPGEAVHFEMDGRTDTVNVTFDSGSPFGTEPSITLNGSDPAQNATDRTIATDARGNYPFSIIPVSTPAPGGGGIGRMDPDKPGTVHGDLDVESDGPPKW
ncbi:hypothetical protein [Hyalangium gracile]|uniref:hypothetical protein n=1 Tax=Hyalangium gracile TaxID=394092 RepID=UPI001CCED034|nr:hypothetical protein [Hyalangium gracile]